MVKKGDIPSQFRDRGAGVLARDRAHQRELGWLSRGSSCGIADVAAGGERLSRAEVRPIRRDEDHIVGGLEVPEPGDVRRRMLGHPQLRAAYLPGAAVDHVDADLKQVGEVSAQKSEYRAVLCHFHGNGNGNAEKRFRGKLKWKFPRKALLGNGIYTLIIILCVKQCNILLIRYTRELYFKMFPIFQRPSRHHFRITPLSDAEIAKPGAYCLTRMGISPLYYIDSVMSSHVSCISHLSLA